MNFSYCRNTFEAHVQADQGKRQDAQYTFPQFIDIVLYGFSELSRFFEQNNLDLNTALDQMDTGMVDGEKGLSLRWNSYWKHCGVCHPDFQPEIIMHMEHLREDMKVMISLHFYCTCYSFIFCRLNFLSRKICLN